MVRMSLKAGKRVRRAIIWIVSLALLLLVLNYILTGRLERYLKKELIERTRLATDGFYRLSFEKLSVSFFNGELKIEGVSLRPDSAVFNRWSAADSLPRTYIRTYIGVIDFEGLNLTWRWDYRRLHFNTFEVKSPEIEVFNTVSPGSAEPDKGHEKSKTLYEVIAPYMDVLSVRTLNLENASISYRVRGEVSPISYRLDNVSFHAYDFRLDSSSYRSGNLLYCRNFDFVTNQPQTLLVNNDFSLKTDSIRLSTEDSMIYIRDIKLEPQVALWENTNQKPSSYLLGRIQTVEAKGIRFDRKEALNYLTARSFGITSSNISLYDVRGEEGIRPKSLVNIGRQVASADSLVQALSLYDVIAPVLHSVSVDEINIERAGLMYARGQGKRTEVFSIPEFNFHARGLLIDSLVEPGQELRYFQSIDFEANGIQGALAAKNHRFDIKRLAMNTATGSFRLDSFRLRPLSSRSRYDYLSAGIDLIQVDGLAYSQGISAGQLLVRSPRIHYYKMPVLLAPKKGKSLDNRMDVESLLSPFLRYLSIRKITVQDAYATLTDRSLSDTVVYRLNGLDFFANDFLIDERTNRTGFLPFSYGAFGFSFRDFDNVIPGGDYRIGIKHGRLSTADRIIRLRQVVFGSAKEGISFTSPQIGLTGLRFPRNKLSEPFAAASLHVETPVLTWQKPDSSRLSVSMDDLDLRGISYDRFSVAGVKDLLVSNGRLAYSWRPDSTVVRTESQEDVQLAVADVTVNLKNKDFRFGGIRLRTHDIQIPLDNGFYLLKVGTLDWMNSTLRLDSVRLVSPYPKMEFAYKQPKHQDWFDLQVGRVALTGLDWRGYRADSLLHIGGLWINDVVLRNLKNRKIPVTPHIVPMIYAGLQKAPLRFRVDTAAVTALSVIYQELPIKGERPGTLYFTDMNGYFSGLTNIVSYPDQYITLYADGKLMGSGPFKATWKLPVDSLNDRFLLTGHLNRLDLPALNQIVRPLAPAEIQSGYAHDVSFFMDASSKAGRVRLDFPYRDLRIAVLREKNGERVQAGFLSRLANLVLRHDNPSHPEKAGSKLRRVDITVERDPYHSTFNYLWQLLRPALVESVGITQKEQEAVRKVTGFFGKVKRFFGIRPKPEKGDPGIDMILELNP